MIEKISCDCGIPIALEAAEVIRLIIELRSNEEIMDYMNKIYGHFRPLWMGNSQKRKFMTLLQNFILRNYENEFREFIEKNKIKIFNGDFEAARKDSTYARFIYIVFLREHINLRPPIVIEDDLGS
jgi:hypothetical protein